VQVHGVCQRERRAAHVAAKVQLVETLPGQVDSDIVLVALLRQSYLMNSQPHQFSYVRAVLSRSEDSTSGLFVLPDRSAVIGLDRLPASRAQVAAECVQLN